MRTRRTRVLRSAATRKSNFSSKRRVLFESLEDRSMMAAFTGGNLVVYRVGDGGASALSNAGNPIFLDEFTPTGQLVQSVAMPTVPSGINHPVLASGTATSEGFLNLSADGRFLTFTGYEQTIGGSTALAGSSLPRVVGRVDVNGNVNTSLSLTDFSTAANPRSAITSNGVDFWITGNAGGVRYVQLNNANPPTTSVLLNDTDLTQVNFDNLQIYNGQLYASTRKLYGSAVMKVGAGLPTTGGQPLGALPSLPQGATNYSFFFATLDTAAHGSQPDTLYMVSDSAGNPAGQIQKFSATTFDAQTGVPTTWASSGAVTAVAARGLTGYVNGANVVMYAATGGSTTSGSGSIYAFTDTSGYNGTMSGSVTTIVASTPNNEAFRGIALAPNTAPTLNSSTATLAAINEDVPLASNVGQLVSQVIASLGANAIADTSGAPKGIAITAADNSNGDWQYSLNNGATWQAVGAVSGDAALLLASDSATRVRFTPNANHNGSVSFSLRAWDQSQGKNGGTFKIATLGGSSAFSTDTATATIGIGAVNDAPTFVRGPSQSVLTTAGLQTIASWATAISPGAGNEAAQSLNFIVSNDANNLFTAQPVIAADGQLTFTPSGISGTATVTVQLHDNGGGADTSAAQTFQITVSAPGADQPPVNSIPFGVQTTLEESPLVFSTANGNLISISDSDALGDVQISLLVTGGTATLGTDAGLSGSGNGTASLTYTGTIALLNAALAGLTFSPASNVNGSGAGKIELTTNDLAAPGNGGPLSATDTITIDITSTNDAPAFVRGADQTVDEGTGTHSVPAWATGISAGPPDEVGQALHFVVSNDNPALFAVQPAISPAGVLSYTLATPSPAATGQAIVTVQLQDDGGTSSGGSDISAAVNFLINVTQVNQPPVNTVPGTQREIKDVPLVFSSSGFNRISVGDIDGFASTEEVTLAATHGTLTIAPLAGVTITTGTGANDALVTFTGTLAQLNAALDGLTFTPAGGYVGLATVQITTNDLNTAGGGSPIITGPTTVNINVVTPPPLVISELMFNPPDVDAPNEYLEIRSAVPNYTIPNGTFLITVSGAPISVQQGSNITTYAPGTVFDTFDLSGKTTGSNGYLVILQNGNTYGSNGLNIVDPQATILDNSVGFGSGAGFGNNLAAPGSSKVGHSALFRPRGDTDMLKPSATYLLVNAPSGINPGDNVDQPASPGGPATGVLHGPQFASWTVFDSVGGSGPTSAVPGEVSYGMLNFLDNTGTTNYATGNSTVVPGSFTGAYFGRTGTNSGSVANDWTASGTINGLVPTFGFGGGGNASPGSFARRPLNNIGSANFDSSLPAVVATTAAPLNYVAGAGAVAIDTGATVTDPDSYFLGSATVAITDGFDPTKDTLAFTNTLSITGAYDAALGVLTLQGFDLFENWNAALESVTYNNNSSASGQPARTVSFAANDRLVLSNVATRVINIQASGAAAPVVGGAVAGSLPYTENGAHVVVAPTLTVVDTGATNLLSATASVALNFGSGQDVLGFDTALAASLGIEGNYVAASGKLFFTGTASVASYQSLLRTVSYVNVSDAPTSASRKITFAVIDTNNTSSSISPAGASRTVTVATVNDAPSLSLAPAPLSYTVGSPAIVIDANLGLVDPDSTSLTGATVTISGGFSAGDVLGYANQLGITGTYNAGTGSLSLTGPSSVSNYRTALQSITYSNSNAATSTATRTISFTTTDGALASTAATRQIQLQSATSIVATNLFYNNSTFDGNSAATGGADDAAIAADKHALLPGQTATFANYSSYKRGINGLMIDIAGLPAAPTVADFTFKVGNSNTPGNWAVGPDATSISVRSGAGVGGSSRVSLVWPDGLVANTWLQVTVNATLRTGLATPQVFYFGNAIGETGNSVANALVNSSDEITTRANAKSFLNPATPTDPYDFDRDGFVNATDQILARSHSTTLAGSLLLISVPSSAQAATSTANADALTAGDLPFGLAVAASPARTAPALGSGAVLTPTLGHTLKNLPADNSHARLFVAALAEEHASKLDHPDASEDDLYDLIAADCLQRSR